MLFSVFSFFFAFFFVAQALAHKLCQKKLTEHKQNYEHIIIEVAMLDTQSVFSTEIRWKIALADEYVTMRFVFLTVKK